MKKLALILAGAFLTATAIAHAQSAPSFWKLVNNQALTPINPAWTVSGTITGVMTSSSFDAGAQVINVKSAPYNAKCNDITDDTTAVNNAIAAAMAGNGTTTNTIYVPGMCLMKGAMVIPHFDFNGLTYQKPLRITGCGESSNGYWNGLTLTNYQGCGLDLQYNAPTSTNINTSTPVAKIDTRGAGLLEIDHLTLKDATSDNSLFIQDTNTTVIIHDDVFSGNTNCYEMSCLQPAIALGGFNATTTGQQYQGSSSIAAFQGYGSEIYNDYFQNVDRVVTFGSAVNGIMVRNLTVSKTSGGAETSSAPLYFNSGTSGNVIVGGTFEVTGYHYMAYMVSTVASDNGNTFSGLGMYDNTASTTGYIYFGTNRDYNLVQVGFLDPALQLGSSTVFGPDWNLQTYLSGGRYLPTEFGPAGAQSASFNSATFSSVTTGLPAGQSMTIDTGSGGSYLYTKAYSNRFQDQGGNTKAEIEAGAAGGGAYFLGKISGGTSTLAYTAQFMDPTNDSSTVLIGASSTKRGCLEFGAASGTIGKLIFVWFDSNAAINATTTRPAFCM